MLSLADLLAHLPRQTTSRALTEVKHGFTYIDGENVRFVVPDLAEANPIKPGSSSVILLSAGAAVGKSTVAKYIAQVTGSPVWDLAGVHVGARSLTGELVEAYGAGAASQVFDDLSKGRLLVVLDALDETALLSGQANFEEFLKDVRSYCQKPLPTPCLVVLARSDTAEIVELSFLEGECPYAHYIIDFFDEPKAKEFIHKALSVRGKANVPLEEARNKLFALVYQLLGIEDLTHAWDDPKVGPFLGYAPVLEAITKYLDSSSPLRLVSELERAIDDLKRSGMQASWDFLSRLIRDILRREHEEKAVPALTGRLRPDADRIGWDDWHTLYGPEEQCQRVLAKHLAAPQPHLPSRLPSELRADYETAVNGFLPDHPFLRTASEFANVVFRDYLYALELANTGSLATAVRTRMQSPVYLPTPLLARFLLAHARDANGEPIVNPRDIGLVYESLTSQADREGDVQFALWSDPDSSVIYGATYASDGVARETTRFRLNDGHPSIWFPRKLAHAEVRVSADIELGSSHGRFILGPAITIDCGTFRCLCSELTVRTREYEDVEIVAEHTDQNLLPPQLRIYGEGVLRVSWPQVQYPWHDYRLAEMPTKPRQINEDYQLLRRALRRFRAEGHEELARHQDIINEIVFANSPRGRKLMEYCLEKGLFSIGGALYMLKRGALDRLRISWTDLQGNRMSDELESFLDAFSKWLKGTDSS